MEDKYTPDYIHQLKKDFAEIITFISEKICSKKDQYELDKIVDSNTPIKDLQVALTPEIINLTKYILWFISLLFCYDDFKERLNMINLVLDKIIDICIFSDNMDIINISKFLRKLQEIINTDWDKVKTYSSIELKIQITMFDIQIIEFIVKLFKTEDLSIIENLNNFLGIDNE